jgi:hypothetical protein
MLNTFLGSLGIPPGQVSLSWPLAPSSPLPISISPSPLLPTCSLLFLHHSTPMYIHQRHFYTHPASLAYFIPALSPYPPFRFFGISYGCPPATSTIPTLTYLLVLLSHVPLPLPGPPHPPAPTCLPYPPFRFFDTFYGCSHATSTIPTLIYLLALFSHVPIHAWPSPCPCLPPPLPPIFTFWGHLWTLFCVYSYPIPSTCVHTWFIALNREHLTAFFGAISCQGKGNLLVSTVGNRPPKAYKYSCMPSDAWSMYPIQQRGSGEAL